MSLTKRIEDAQTKVDNMIAYVEDERQTIEDVYNERTWALDDYQSKIDELLSHIGEMESELFEQEISESAPLQDESDCTPTQ